MGFSSKRGFGLACVLGMMSVFGHAQSTLSLKSTGTTGTISGKIVDNNAQPVGGILVAAVRTFPIIGVAGQRSGFTHTDGSGNFSIAGLTPASYKICAEPVGQALLDPCMWSTRPATWNLLGGQTAHVSIQLQAAVWIQARVNDPTQVAAQYEQQTGISYVLGGYAASGTPLRFEQLSSDSTGKNFRFAAPAGASVPVYLDLQGLVAQVLGPNALSGALPILNSSPISVAVGQTNQSISFTIQ